MQDEVRYVRAWCSRARQCRSGDALLVGVWLDVAGVALNDILWIGLTRQCRMGEDWLSEM